MSDGFKCAEYPSPAIVVGVGRFGLAVLERLGEEWEGLARTTEDATLKNLRLLHVRPAEEVDPGQWRKNEREFVEIARYTGDGDLPTLALDFVILRSLGLVRYRDGTYQVAVPRDGGVVEVPSPVAEEGAEVDDDMPGADFARRRYFDWLNLSPDPINSVERLRILQSQRAELDLFVTPLVNRIRQGHSPRAVLACMSRCRSLADGRDPWPWSWLFRDLVEAGAAPDGGGAARRRRVRFEREWLSRLDTGGFLEGLASSPLSGWKAWLQGHRTRRDLARLDELDLPDEAFDLCLPEAFWPEASDLASPISPFELLKVDWEATGWATREFDELDVVEFEPVRVSPFRLGLFDHDDSSRIHTEHGQAFGDRLQELAIHAHRGLVRMWVDLQRERIESSDEAVEHGRRRDNVDTSLGQSLEVLGELLVRPLLYGEDDETSSWLEGEPPPAEGLPERFSERASSFLRELVVEDPPPENAARRALDERLAELGFEPPGQPDRRRMLFSEVALTPDDVGFEVEEPTVVDPDLVDEVARGLTELRRFLNERTRRLLDFSFLKEYRDEPAERAPRLTIYVVCDVTEAFSRASMRTLLREIHAELLRAFGPIFETYREGFDRALSVVPIIWMPHPADTFGGAHPLANRCEEAAIIEAIQGVRRWVESVPLGKRCIPKVIINSRVTDNAVLTFDDAVRQTRDFLDFQTRNDLSSDPWLRRTAVGPPEDDFFATFSCLQIDFPAERAREYLANRYARHSMRRLADGERGRLPELREEPIDAPEVDDLVAEPTDAIAEQCEREADSMHRKVEDRLLVDSMTTAEEVADSFDESFETQLLEAIQRRWERLTRRRGDMDEMVDALRRDTSEELGETLEVVEEAGDRLIEEHAQKGGLKRAHAGFYEFHARASEKLREREAARRDREELCLEHRIPRTHPIGSARGAVLSASDDKPDGGPMRAGIIIWAVMAPALGAPIAWAVAKRYDLHLEPNALEVLLGPLGPLIGGLLVFLPVFLLLRRHMNAHIERLEEAIERMAGATRRVVDGGSASLSSSPSIRSFMEARLEHTAALTTRSFARQVYARVLRDLELAGRLRRSVDLQREVVGRRAEDLGVRVEMTGREGDAERDDVRRLFASRLDASVDKLIDPEQLLDYYERRIGDDRQVDQMLETFIEEIGGFDNWRRVAAMSDTERIMRFARGEFDELLAHPVSQQFVFEEEVRRRLLEFVRANYPNVGFGAKFSGYEGLDPSGVEVLADSTLVLHPELEPVFEEARRAPEAPSSMKTVEVETAKIQPNDAYLLSLVQGIRPHSVRNLRRFESFHHRAHMPDDRAFPVYGEGREPEASRPINHLTGYDALRDSLNRGVFDFAGRARKPRPSADEGGDDE